MSWSVPRYSQQKPDVEPVKSEDFNENYNRQTALKSERPDDSRRCFKSIGGVRRSPTQVLTRVTCDQRSPTQVLTRVTCGQHAEK